MLPVLVVCAFLSYSQNFFRVTSDHLFLNHQLDSEALVLDGLLRKADGHDLSLGSYSRPEISDPVSIAHRLYAEKNISGEFASYRSQFGLQVHLFSWVAENVSPALPVLQGLAALLMSLVVGLLYLGMKREFCTLSALVACGILIFSPWTVIFARNLYWLEATWFFPAALSFLLAKAAFTSRGHLAVLGCLLFFAFLVKFLCGYEYMTAVGIASVVPAFYIALKHGFGVKVAFRQALVCAAVFGLAFAISLMLHAISLDDDLVAGLEKVSLVAKKRLATQSIDDAANDACIQISDLEKCKAAYSELLRDSFESSRLMVAAQYFVMPHFIPWGDRFEFSKEDKAILREGRKGKSVRSNLVAVSGIGYETVFFKIFEAFSPFAFFVLCFVFLRLVVLVNGATRFAGLLALSGPLSWFLLAKGHAYHHFHLNYVLWYLIFLPFGLALIVQELRLNRELFDRVFRLRRKSPAEASKLQSSV